MKTNEKISVIIPVYNVESYLRFCLNSVIEQTYRNLEIILVDDGSPDNSGQICDEYEKKDNRVKVIHKENGGLSSARNAGLEIAKGEYISFVDSDDWIKPEFIEVLYNNLIKAEADISICKFQRKVHHCVENDYKINQQKEVLVFNRNQAVESMFVFNRFQSQVCTMLFKRHLFADIRFPFGRKYEDQFITYKLIWSSSRIVFTNEENYFYFTNLAGISHSYSGREDLLLAYDEALNFFSKNSNVEITRYVGYRWVETYLRQYSIFLDTDNVVFYRAEYVRFQARAKGFLFSKHISFKSRILYVAFVFFHERGLRLFKKYIR